jgi:hypothetical protein
MSDDPSPRLAVELIPKPCWGKNLRNALPRAKWEQLSDQVRTQYNQRCGICGASGKLHCHERWRYDETAFVQRLDGLIALCELCHQAKHMGRTATLAREGVLDYNRVVEHFCQVNKCSRGSFDIYLSEEYADWDWRNKHEWRTDFGEYAARITQLEGEATQ